MTKSSTRVILGFALTLAGAALVFAGPASAQTGAYTDPSRDVRASLEREHLVLGHTDAVRQQSAAERRGVAARTTAPANFQGGAYTDPDRNVRASLEREHLVLSHPYAVREPSAAERRTLAAQKAAPFYASADPVYPIGKDLSILSQQ